MGSSRSGWRSMSSAALVDIPLVILTTTTRPHAARSSRATARPHDSQVRHAA